MTDFSPAAIANKQRGQKPDRTRTFIVEVCFDKPPKDAKQEQYIRASLEEGIVLCWHDYIANVEVAPQIPVRIGARKKISRSGTRDV